MAAEGGAEEEETVDTGDCSPAAASGGLLNCASGIEPEPEIDPETEILRITVVADAGAEIDVADGGADGAAAADAAEDAASEQCPRPNWLALGEAELPGPKVVDAVRTATDAAEPGTPPSLQRSPKMAEGAMESPAAQLPGELGAAA